MSISRKTDQPFSRSGDKLLPPFNFEIAHGSTGINEFSGTNFYPLFESVSDAIFLLDGDKVVDCNNKTLEMFACKRKQIIDHSLGKYLPPKQQGGSDYQEKIKQIIDTVLRGEAQFLECNLTRSDNIIFNAEVSFNYLELKGKKLIHCIARDVTERKREKEFYELLAISSLIGIYVLCNGKFHFVNPKFQEYVGYSANELIGMNSMDIVHPEDRESVRKNAVKMLKMQQPAPYEFRTITKSGQIKWTMEIVMPFIFDGKRAILGNYVDIDDRKKSEEALKTSEERYRTILENIENGYYEIDLKGRLTFFNEACRKIFGYTCEELTGMKHRQFVDRDTSGKLIKLAGKVYRTGQPEKCSDFEIIRKEGFKRHIEISLSLMRDLSGNPIGFRGIVRDIDDRKKAETTIAHMAYHDALTGLPNRLLFTNRLNVVMSAAQRNNKKFAVMMLDLDGFKLINDLLGHDIGDLLLQNVGDRLRAHLRKSDMVARMGGDEFMLLLPEINQKKDAEVIARKIVDSFHRIFILKNHELKITASIGIAVYPYSGVDFDTLKKKADMAMYKVKEKGGDNFQS